MLDELRKNYHVHGYVAVLKAKNFRSDALLRKLGFVRGTGTQEAQHRDEQEEIVMIKSAGKTNVA